MNILNYIKRPEYVWHPRQAMRRLLRIGKEPLAIEDIKLPWGATVRVHTGENIGRDIYLYGIFDKIVPEAIWRLLDSGESAVEVGANIGQNVSLMVHRVGPTGRVIAFEAHPEIYAELAANAKGWKPNAARNLSLFHVAMGEEPGAAVIKIDEEFLRNRGSASIRQVDQQAERAFQVRVDVLDAYVTDWPKIALCKIDVEGKELEVLKGAKNAIHQGRIRDVIFEDFEQKPSPVTKFLSNYGFTIYELHQTLLKPRLADVTNESVPGFSYNYLATLEPERSVARFRSPGWKCLMNF
jgi:FkbM family methyltransferase